ncbi:MAG TPA: flagellar biosynthesis protein FlhB [Lachnospiraceae bacterium]|nr:flagellar biosynthesis protein FlhB [Lachnospiraceae bacterium]
MILKYNLQFFASDGPGGEKTEPATEKKLSDARKEGQVAKSKEVGNAISLLAMFLVIRFWAGRMGIQFLEVFSTVYKEMPDTVVNWNGYLPQNDMLLAFRQIIIQILYLITPVFIVAFIAAILGDVIQIRWMVTGKPLQPKFSKMNPLSGFKRIFSTNAIAELIKSILKILIIVYISYTYLKDKWPYIYLLYDMTLVQAIQLVGELVTDLGIRISVVYIAIALADYIFQRVKFSRDMRMTKQEIKDEYKQQEGDPQIKGKIRQRMQEASRRRMMQNLPKADVVITNPTHYAVAIQYDPDIAAAPIVLAKGENYMAQRIKKVAKENEIEIVENKPLARMLYANVDVGSIIPPELYQAVAEVLAFVYQLKGKS